MNILYEDETLQEKEDLQRQKESFKQFICRLQDLKALNQEYSDIFPIIVTGELQQNIRLKVDRKCAPDQMFIQLNRSIQFLGKISMEGVKKLDIEINRFEGKLEPQLIKSFLTNLSMLKSLKSINVTEFINKDKNPYTFLLFSSYEPIDVNQLYSFTNVSMGRYTVITSQLSQKGVIKQTYEFNESNTYDQDPEATHELKQFFQIIYELSTQIGYTDYLIQDNCREKKKSIYIHQLFCSSTYNKLIESTFFFLKMQEQDKRIKHVTLDMPKYLKNKMNELYQDADLSKFIKLEIFKKFKLKLVCLNKIDLIYFKQFINHIKGLELKNNYSSNSLNLEILLQKKDIQDYNNINYKNNNGDEDATNNMQLNQSNGSNDSNFIPYLNKNFTTLRIFDIGSLDNHLDYQFKLIESIPNLQKAFVSCLQSLSSVMIFTKYKPNITECIDKLSYFNFQRLFEINKQGYLYLNLVKINFNTIPFSVIEEILLSVKRPYHLVIQTYNHILKERKGEEIANFLQKIIFKNNIVSLDVCLSIKQQLPDLVKIISQAKSFAKQEILFNHLIRPFMIYNPDHIFQDLFDFDD